MTHTCGPYSLRRRIGEGDLGTTWEAQRGEEPAVTLKRPHQRLRQCYEVFAAAARGADLAAQQDPLVLGALAQGWDESVLPHAPYVVTPLRSEPTLAATVDSGACSGQRALRLIRSVAATLLRAHAQGLHHGDLHPLNVYVLGDDRCVLGDFPSARVFAAARAAGLTVARSYPACAFLASEVFDDPRALSPAADVFSLGALLWFALTGQPPDRPLSQARPPALSASLDVLLRRMMSPDPAQRPPLPVVLEELTPRRVADITLREQLAEDARWKLYSAERAGEPCALRLYADHAQRPGRAPLSAAQLLKMASVPHLVQVRDCGIADERAFVLLAPLPPARLAERDRDRRLGRAAYAVALQILSVLRSLHSMEVLYLGLCPDTIALTMDSTTREGVRALVIDCESVTRRGQRPQDLLRTLDAGRLEHAAAPLLYLAPEQLCASGAIGPEADIYALGALLYFMLTGAAPAALEGSAAAPIVNRSRAARHLRLNAAEAPQEAELLIEHMMGTDPSHRPCLEEVEHQLRCLALAAPLLAERERGPYRLLRVLAFGGMSVVFEGERRDDRHPVAIKVPLPEVPVGRAQQEAELLQRLPRHPGLVPLLDVLPLEGERRALVLERVRGELCGRGPLEPAEVLRIGLQTSSALCAAHQVGVIHRDIKTANLLRVGRQQIKVIDFGVALDSEAPAPDGLRRTSYGAALGTDRYMAPEQRADPRKVDARADVYSLGVTLYELSTGSLPDQSDAPPVADAALRQLLDEMRAPQRERRPSMTQVERRLRGLLQRRPLPGWVVTLSQGAAVLALAGASYALWPAHVEIQIEQGQVEAEIRDADSPAGRLLGTASAAKPWRRRHSELRGVHALLVRAPGFHREWIEITKGRSQDRRVTLQPTTWKIEKVAGKTTQPLALEGYLGEFHVDYLCKTPGFKTKQLVLDSTVDRDEKVVLEPVLLTIRSSTAGAQVRVDGVKRGAAPVTLELPEIAFSHPPKKVTVTAPGCEDQQVSVPSKADTDTVVPVDLPCTRSPHHEAPKEPPRDKRPEVPAHPR